MRVNPSMVVALVAVVVAASGGAYAATTTSSKTIAACVRHSGGTVYVAKRCRRHDKRLTWNTTGPRGVAGAPGNQGAQGLQGPPGTPDPSQFYDKATSDGRFVHGSGTITPIPAIDVPNATGATIADVPGVGTFETKSCAAGNSTYRYLNPTAANETVVITNQFQADNNDPPVTASLGPTGFISDPQNSATDVEHVSVAIGTTGVAEFSISQARTTAGHCLYWGEVYVG